MAGTLYHLAAKVNGKSADFGPAGFIVHRA
jgi:hypothetical protein